MLGYAARIANFVIVYAEQQQHKLSYILIILTAIVVPIHNTLLTSRILLVKSAKTRFY